MERLCGGVWWTWFGGKGIKGPEQRILCSGVSCVDRKDASVKPLPQGASTIVRRTDEDPRISPSIQLSVRSFVYKDAKSIGAENHHTTREAVLTIIVNDCFM